MKACARLCSTQTDMVSGPVLPAWTLDNQLLPQVRAVVGGILHIVRIELGFSVRYRDGRNGHTDRKTGPDVGETQVG